MILFYDTLQMRLAWAKELENMLAMFNICVLSTKPLHKQAQIIEMPALFTHSPYAWGPSGRILLSDQRTLLSLHTT